jgi:RNA polymerase sigma-70 factor (ECF subfamily)
MVEQALSLLSEDDRELLRLRYIADLPIKDVARVLGLSSVAVRVRLHRALARARNSLAKHNFN